MGTREGEAGVRVKTREETRSESPGHSLCRNNFFHYQHSCRENAQSITQCYYNKGCHMDMQSSKPNILIHYTQTPLGLGLFMQLRMDIRDLENV